MSRGVCMCAKDIQNPGDSNARFQLFENRQPSVHIIPCTVGSLHFLNLIPFITMLLESISSRDPEIHEKSVGREFCQNFGFLKELQDLWVCGSVPRGGVTRSHYRYSRTACGAALVLNPQHWSIIM